MLELAIKNSLFHRATCRTVLMRLSPKQEQILAAAHLQANASIAELARTTGYRAHSVRYCLEELAERKIIQRFPLINIHALGITDYCVFLAPAASKRVPRARLLQFFCSYPNAAFVAELSGEFSYTVSLFARSVFEIENFFGELTATLPDVSFQKSFALRTRWTLFPPKSSGARRTKLVSLTRGAASSVLTLDRLDQQVLYGIAQHPTSSVVQLARLLGLPQSTIYSRLQQLEKRKVILGYVWWIESQLLGVHPFRILLTEKGSSAAFADAFALFAQRHSAIVQLVRCVGEWDYEVNLELKDPAELNEVVQEIYDRFGEHLDTAKSLAHLKLHKMNQYPFPPLPD